MVNKKHKFVYLVYCNKEPIVYAVYGREKPALKYAQSLIEYRRQRALERGFTFSFFHYLEPKDFDYYRNQEGELVKRPFVYSDIDLRERDRFSCCLCVRQDDGEWGDNGCWIRVVRRLLQ